MQRLNNNSNFKKIAKRKIQNYHFLILIKHHCEKNYRYKIRTLQKNATLSGSTLVSSSEYRQRCISVTG